MATDELFTELVVGCTDDELVTTDELFTELVVGCADEELTTDELVTELVVDCTVLSGGRGSASVTPVEKKKSS